VEHPLLEQIDLRTKRVVRQLPVGHLPLAVAHGDGFLFVAHYDAGNITQVDLSTGEETTLDIASSPNGLVFSDGELWISNYGDSTVIEYDPVLHQDVNVIHLDSQPEPPAIGFGHVWVPLGTYEEVDEIDPRTGQIVARISTGDMDPAGIAVGDGAVWVTTAEPGSI
jgi:streptogramin lyase